MENRLISLRRELHKNPEIGFDLPRTLTILRRELDEIGVEYTEKYGKSSIVATVNPDKCGFTIGVRADIDALPITEKNDTTYRSEIEGQMHACGHDAHAAIGVETLRRVYAMREDIPCRVKFLFQSAEEYAPSGAKLMVEDGVMDDIDCIVALHCDGKFETGEIGFIDGPMNARSDGFKLKFRGRSAHAARQEQGADAIMMAVRAYTDIEFMVAKEVAAKTPVIFNVGSIHGGVTNNIISDECELFCTLRSWDDDFGDHILERIKAICTSVAESGGGSYEFIRCKQYPIVQNDPRIGKRLTDAVRKLFGDGAIKARARELGGEDFSYMARVKPGYMFRLGIRNEALGITNVELHTDCFSIDEAALEVGVRVFTEFIIDNADGKLLK